MLVFIVRLLFFLAMVAAGYVFGDAVGDGKQLTSMLGFGVAAVVVIVVDLAFRRKNISVVSAVFFGLLVGLVVAMLLGPVVDMYQWIDVEVRQALKVGIAAVTSYLAISIILQTKDDFRFIIPYIEFAKQRKGGRPLLLDTSVIIDGRIADIAETRFIDSPIIVPRFILHELQSIADSSEKMRRDRGRRGLDILNRLQTTPHVDIRIQDTRPEAPAGESPDQSLVNLAAHLNGRVVTVDYNLNKVAQLARVDVLNVNDLANALKSTVIPGEELEVTVLKPGQEEGQGVGYLDDGTMVVVEDGQKQIGQVVSISVTNVLQKSAGRIIFGRIGGRPRRRS
ncbi:MAG: TRAM domain-containing protein [Planctomycetes bacterium]|nr:TRAM domain-containing protein [Planctomycetota bacterium]